MQILPREPSFSEKIGSGLGQLLGIGSASAVNKLMGDRSQSQENEALKRLTGQDFSGITPDMKKEFMKLYTGGRAQKEQEKQKMLETGLGTIQQMRDLLEYAGGWSSGIGNKLASLLPMETQQKRAELSQLGKSLIPLVSTGVSIRNQKEFDEYKKLITDPNSSPAELEGALNGLESIISRSASKSPLEDIEMKSSLPIFDIDNPTHKKVFDALMKKYRGDRDKVRRELSRHYEE